MDNKLTINTLDNLAFRIREVIKYYKVASKTDKFSIQLIEPLLKLYNGNDWMQYSNNKLDKGNYIKIKIPITDDFNDCFDMYIISWSNNSNSPIHNHPENGCISKLLVGEISEHIFSEDLCIIDINNYKENDIMFITDVIGLHKITNNTNNYAYSLHIYSPPNYVPIVSIS